MIVVDASVALAWSHKDERTDAVRRISELVGETGAVVPFHWPIEIANGLAMAVRRGRIGVAERDELVANFRRLAVEVESPSLDIAWTNILWLAHKHRLTPYDAAYLELAVRRRLPLATLDEELAAAARAEGTTVLP